MCVHRSLNPRVEHKTLNLSFATFNKRVIVIAEWQCKDVANVTGFHSTQNCELVIC